MGTRLGELVMIRLNKKQRRALRHLAKMPPAKSRKQHGRRIDTRIERHAR